MKMIALFFIMALGLPNYSYEQSTPGLETALARKFPADSKEEGRWVFYAYKANIRKVDKPTVKACIPNYDLYQVDLTNYLGYHIYQGTCLVLFDSARDNIRLVEPIWYSGRDKAFNELFLGQKFGTKDSLLNFLVELGQLRQIGSGYKFRLTSNADSLNTYNLEYFNRDTDTTGGNATSSTIRIDIKDLTIVKIR